MMDYGLIFTIIGAAWLAKSLMQAFERMEKGTKKRPRSCGKQLRGRLHKVTTKA